MNLTKPLTPNFSSGPCNKHFGWKVSRNLNNSLVGRSHRSKSGKLKIKGLIELTKKVLEIPKDYFLGIRGPLHVVRYNKEYLFSIVDDLGFNISKFDYTILRLSNVFGPHSPSSVVGLMLTHALKEKKIACTFFDKTN